jgi:hypothetical protein
MMMMMELTRLVLDVLGDARDGCGHTCLPLDTLAWHVRARAGPSATDPDFRRALHALRSQGAVVVTSRPMQLVALRALMEADRFIFDTLCCLEGGGACVCAAAGPNGPEEGLLGGGPQDAVSRAIDDAMSEGRCPDLHRLAVLSSFYERGPLAVRDHGGGGGALLGGLLLGGCARVGCRAVCLWREARSVRASEGGPAPSLCETYDAFLARPPVNALLEASASADGAAMLVMFDATRVTSAEMRAVLIRLPSSVKVVLVGDPGDSAGGGVFFDVIDSPLVRALSLTRRCPDACHGAPASSARRLCEGLRAGVDVSWVTWPRGWRAAFGSHAVADAAASEGEEDDLAFVDVERGCAVPWEALVPSGPLVACVVLGGGERDGPGHCEVVRLTGDADADGRALDELGDRECVALYVASEPRAATVPAGTLARAVGLARSRLMVVGARQAVLAALPHPPTAPPLPPIDGSHRFTCLRKFLRGDLVAAPFTVDGSACVGGADASRDWS